MKRTTLAVSAHHLHCPVRRLNTPVIMIVDCREETSHDLSYIFFAAGKSASDDYALGADAVCCMLYVCCRFFRFELSYTNFVS